MMEKAISRMNKHIRSSAQLLGPRGGRFLAKIICAFPGCPLPVGATALGIVEYAYHAPERPIGNKTGSMRLDVMFVILFPKMRFSVGLEVKTNEDDLVFDVKLHHELVADYLFLAVPRELIPAALFVIRRQRPDCIRRIGLVDLNDDDIVVLPERSTRILKMEDVLATAILRGTRVDIAEGVPKAEFVRRGRLNINKRYSGMLAIRYTPRLPRPERCHDRFRHSPLFQELLAEETRAGPA